MNDGSRCGHEMQLLPGHRMRLKTDGFPKRGQSDWLTNAQLEYFVLAFRGSELLPLNSQSIQCQLLVSGFHTATGGKCFLREAKQRS